MTRRLLPAVPILVLASASACSTTVTTAPSSAPVDAPPPVAARAGPTAPPPTTAEASDSAPAPVPEQAPFDAPTSVLDGVFTEAQAARGGDAYAAHCAECHGEDLAGGEMAPGLTGVAFRFRWRGLNVADIFESIESTMPPEEPGTLDAQAYVDLVAFLLGANRYPAGERELAADLGLLERLAVERAPP